MAKFQVKSMADGSFSDLTGGGGSTYTALSGSAAFVSNEDIQKICMAGAEILIQKLREFLGAHTKGTGLLAQSITATPIWTFVMVGPKGKHHGSYTSTKGTHRSKTGQGRSHKRRHHGLTNGVSAMDVGYYLEYGTPRMNALHWMQTVVEESGDEVQAAMEKAWDEFLTSKGL